jgi:hypothetical protein
VLPTTNRKSETLAPHSFGSAGVQNLKFASGVGVGSSVGVGMIGGVGASVGVRVFAGDTRLPASEPMSGNAMHMMMTSAMTAIISRRCGESDFISKKS